MNILYKYFYNTNIYVTIEYKKLNSCVNLNLKILFTVI